MWRTVYSFMLFEMMTSPSFQFAVAGRVGVDTVVITVTDNYLNLAEVQLFDQLGRQISPASLIFTLSSILNGDASYVANKCNDGIIPASESDEQNLCHTNAETGAFLRIQIIGGLSVNQIVIWNRVDCCQDRINGATVAAYVGGAMVWSTIVPSTSAMMYSFVVGYFTTGMDALKLTVLL
jgi:hypothetical protein